MPSDGEMTRNWHEFMKTRQEQQQKNVEYSCHRLCEKSFGFVDAVLPWLWSRDNNRVNS